MGIVATFLFYSLLSFFVTTFDGFVTMTRDIFWGASIILFLHFNQGSRFCLKITWFDICTHRWRQNDVLMLIRDCAIKPYEIKKQPFSCFPHVLALGLPLMIKTRTKSTKLMRKLSFVFLIIMNLTFQIKICECMIHQGKSLSW